jgi:glycine cleavage system H protein
LKNNPALINQSPYEKGWMIRIRMSNPAEAEALLNAEGYEKALGAHA